MGANWFRHFLEIGYSMSRMIVGLVNHSIKTIIADNELALAA